MLKTTLYLPALKRLAADQRGVTAIVTGIAMLVILGFGGLAIDVAYWLNATRTMQAAADQAAYSAAAAAKTNGCASTTARPQAIAITAARGYPITGTPTTSGDTMTLTDGSTTLTIKCTASNSNFTVKVEQRQPMWFASMFMSTAPMAAASATAKLASAVTDLCVLALDGATEGVPGTDASAAQMGGSTTVNLHCGLAVDSSSVAGLDIFGSGDLTATNIYLSGDLTGDPSHYRTSPTADKILRNQPPVEDPYLGRPMPTPTACTHTVSGGEEYNSTVTLSSTVASPMVWCGGVNLGGTSTSTVTLNPGVYYVVGGSLQINSKVSLIGTGGVTFVLTGNMLGQTGFATVAINGSADVQLVAPTTGATAGMVFFQDRNAPASTTANCGGSAQNKLNGTGDVRYTGALYFPNQSVCFTGNSATSGAGQCSQLIAKTIAFTGNSDVKLVCAGTGIEPMTVLVPTLIH